MKKREKSENGRWIYTCVGERIRAARRRYIPKLTQDSLAAAIGMNRASVAKIEAGSQRFTLDTLFAIAAKLNCEPAELLPSPNDFKMKSGGERAILAAARAPEGLRVDEMNSILKAIKKHKPR